MGYKHFTSLNDTADYIYISDQNQIIEFMNKSMIQVFSNYVGKKSSEINKENYKFIKIPFSNDDGTFSDLNICKNNDVKKNSSVCDENNKDDYKRIFEHVAVGVFISSKEGKFIDANPALLKMLKYDKKEQFLNLELKCDIYLNMEERTKFQEMIEAKKKVTNYKVVWKCSDNSTISVLLTAHVRYDINGEIIGYEGICVDQSRRLKMEKDLREAHEFLNKIIQSSPNAIMGTDMKGNIIIWNRGAEEIFEYKKEEVIKKMHVKDLYGNNLAIEVMKIIRSNKYGIRGKLRSYPITLTAKNKQRIEGNLSANIIYNEKREEMASVGIFVDLRDQLVVERKLRLTQEQLLQSEKLAAMGRLTSQIAHELNNPLYGIMNTFELLKTEIKQDNKRRKLLDMALSETERLTDMLHKMLSFSKPDQEQRSNLDINIILDEILLLYKKQLSEYSIKIFNSMDRSIKNITASKNQLRQVFLNIISNAKDSMPVGGNLIVETKSDNDFVYITISDTGVGIKKEHIPLIFESFFTTKIDSVKGVGLGLSVCYGFIKDHGGNIEVKSKLKEGTSFTIKLPFSCN